MSAILRKIYKNHDKMLQFNILLTYFAKWTKINKKETYERCDKIFYVAKVVNIFKLKNNEATKVYFIKERIFCKIE